MSANISERIKVDKALNYQSLNASNANTVFFSMANYDRIEFIVQSGATFGGKWNIEVYQSTDNTAGNASSLYATITNANITAVNTVTTVEVRADKLDVANAYYYVGARITEVNSSASTGVASAIRFPARYNQASMLS